MERDYYGEIASEQKYQRGEYAWVDEVDAARATEAAQHQQEKDTLRTMATRLTCWRCGTAAYQPNERCDSHMSWTDRLQTEVEHHNAWRKRADEAEAERDRLKAALSKITALDFEKFNGRHNFYSGAVMFVKAWLLAYAALTPHQGQSTDGETR
jgi:adenine-specific DNA methylase